MKRIFFLIVIISLTIKLSAQMVIIGELRPRTEFRDGYRTLRSEETEPAFFISQRSRINFSYSSDLYAAFISVQDVRVWGDEKYNTDTPALAVHEAWVKFKILEGLTAKIGRQCIGYDNNWILGKANWNQSSKKHDAIMLSYNNKSWSIDFTNAFNQASENVSGTDYSQNSNYKYLSYLWATRKTEKFSVSAFGLADGYQYAHDTVYTRLTYGIITRFSLSDISLSARYFQQGGKLISGMDIFSYLMNVEAGYKVRKANIIAGLEISSGADSKISDAKSHVFETPYGAKHWVYGTMDYFKKTSDTKGTGLVDGYLKFSLKLNNKSSVLADYHWFSSHKNYFVKDVAMPKYLASEIDMVYRHQVVKDMNLECGYSILKGSTTLQTLKAGDASKLNHWAYLMLTFKPTFFKN